MKKPELPLSTVGRGYVCKLKINSSCIIATVGVALERQQRGKIFPMEKAVRDTSSNPHYMEKEVAQLVSRMSSVKLQQK